MWMPRLIKDEADHLIERMESFTQMNWHGYPVPLLVSDWEREALAIATGAAAGESWFPASSTSWRFPL